MSTYGRVGENWAQVWECAPMGGSAACLGYSLQKQAERGGGDAAPSRLMLSSLWPSPLLSERTADTDSMFWYLILTHKFPRMQEWESLPLPEHTSRRGCSDWSLTCPCLLPGVCGDMAETATSPPTTVATYSFGGTTSLGFTRRSRGHIEALQFLREPLLLKCHLSHLRALVLNGVILFLRGNWQCHTWLS